MAMAMEWQETLDTSRAELLLRAIRAILIFKPKASSGALIIDRSIKILVLVILTRAIAFFLFDIKSSAT